MNIEHMKKLRAFIVDLAEEQCDMTEWFYRNEVTDKDCGCIGGWAAVLGGYSASSFLDLSLDDIDDLFYDFDDSPLPFANWKEWMLARLDSIIRDGKILPAASQMRRPE